MGRVSASAAAARCRIRLWLWTRSADHSRGGPYPRVGPVGRALRRGNFFGPPRVARNGKSLTEIIFPRKRADAARTVAGRFQNGKPRDIWALAEQISRPSTSLFAQSLSISAVSAVCKSTLVQNVLFPALLKHKASYELPGVHRRFRGQDACRRGLWPTHRAHQAPPGEYVGPGTDPRLHARSRRQRAWLYPALQLQPRTAAADCCVATSRKRGMRSFPTCNFAASTATASVFAPRWN